MPNITLAHYIALRAMVTFHEGSGYDTESLKLIEEAKEALHALRKFFPAFELWEREQVARVTP